MKQFQFIYQNDESLRRELDAIKDWRGANPSYSTVFRLYTEDMDMAHIQHICDILDEQMPDALYLGCTTNANILDGAYERSKIILTCTVFEYETTQVKILQFPFGEENAKDVVDALKEYCAANPWVSAVEIHVTMLGMSVREFCDAMSTLPENIQVFGGGAYSPNMDGSIPYVFSREHGIQEHGIVFLLLGGSDFHTYSTLISGWKPLKRKFKVTKARRELLCELNGEPAFNIYQRFLNISKSDKLIANTLEFPLYMDYNGFEVLRCALGVTDDDALVMATDVPENTDVRLAYGDPETILSSIRSDGQRIANFQPEVIQTFSCAARKAFWGDENISDETLLINGIAPTSGLYTSGEFLRIDGEVRNFNITLILAAMREGEPKDGNIVNIYDTRMEQIENDRLPLIRRFVSFIDSTTAELEELNQKLARTSITDGLTGLNNRAETERRIHTAMEESRKSYRAGALSLIMIDIDNFKRINDVYGHKEGDRVIIAIADVMRKVTKDIPNCSLGRWGGEEFMVLLPGHTIDEAAVLADRIRMEFAAIVHKTAGRQTASMGVVQAKRGENADAFYIRVDKALYKAKDSGKNQVVRQE